MLQNNLALVLSKIYQLEDTKIKLDLIDSASSIIDAISSKLQAEKERIEQENQKRVYDFPKNSTDETENNVVLEAEEILKGQEKIHEKILKLAHDKGLSSPTLNPIWDGIYPEGVKEYIKGIRIMWILKEPYAEFDDEGNPICKGYPIYDGLEEDEPTITGTQKNMIYVTEGIQNGLHWNDMLNYSHYINHLKNIVFINISKMPAYSTSGDMSKKYDKWKDIIHDQLELYKPQIIICGYTLDYIWEDRFFEGFEMIKPASEYEGQTSVWKKGNVLLLDAYHPCMKGQKYVDALINAVRNNL